jgi:hypothetical protein
VALSTLSDPWNSYLQWINIVLKEDADTIDAVCAQIPLQSVITNDQIRKWVAGFAVAYSYLYTMNESEVMKICEQ